MTGLLVVGCYIVVALLVAVYARAAAEKGWPFPWLAGTGSMADVPEDRDVDAFLAGALWPFGLLIVLGLASVWVIERVAYRPVRALFRALGLGERS